MTSWAAPNSCALDRFAEAFSRQCWRPGQRGPSLTFLGLAFALLSCLSPRVQELFHLLLMLVAGYNNIGTGYSAAALLTGVAWPVHKYKGQSDFQSPSSHFQSLSSHFQSFSSHFQLFSSHFQSFSSHFQSFRVNHSNYKPCDTSKFINNSSPSRSSFP